MASHGSIHVKSAALKVVELPEYFVTTTQCSIEPVLTCTITGYPDFSVLYIDFSDVLSGPVDLYPYLVAIVDYIAYSKSMPSFFNVSGDLLTHIAAQVAAQLLLVICL